jgi:hypothetical protein
MWQSPKIFNQQNSGPFPAALPNKSFEIHKVFLQLLLIDLQQKSSLSV